MDKIKAVHVIRVGQTTPERRKELRQLTREERRRRFPFIRR